MFLTSGILIGLVGSLHCVGMCGPIALLIPVNEKNKTTEIISILTYNLGRIATYSILGLLFGVLGTGFVMAGYQSALSITIGAIILVSVLIPMAVNRLSPKSVINRWVHSLKKKLGLLLQQKKTSTLFLIGLLNGLLPCGLVYLAIAGAIASGTILHGSIFMMGFGLGTMPAMVGIMYFKKWLQPVTVKKIRNIVPYMVGAMGVLLILRGLNLGIPYISPEIAEGTHNGFSSCCHKP